MHDFLHRQQSQEILPTRGMAIVCPLSYANDEPVDAILDAAASTPELTWVLTGVAPQEVIGRATPNVSFPGFIPRPSYTRLVAEAAVIVALTNRPHTMQRAGYEALMFERAQVTADFPELRDFLGGASLYSGLSSSEITETVRRAFQSRDELQVEAHRVLSTRIEEQTLVIRELKAQMKYADRPG
ncbi:hypothetical protein ACT3S2_15365 [Arthrobacter sp. AOP36-A1-22]|uniref:hypothetical protein n=1 Tax=Arthrobacter sp. AOP36-A1-22 TaxID=3457684 RepID=UPI00403443C6